MTQSSRSAKQPSLRRRASRQAREDATPVTHRTSEPITNGVHSPEYHPAQAPPPPRTDQVRFAEQPVDAFSGATKAPQQPPPPPPPRPEKVRTESRNQGQDQSRAYAPEQYYAGANAYVPVEPHSPASPGVDSAHYVQAAARRQQRQVAGRA